MDCPEFRRHHLAYVDDTLPGDVLVAAELHRAECPSCAAHDTRVRRSLLLARNLPALEPSADFTARLHARLREEMAAGRPAAPTRESDRYEWLGGVGNWGRQAAAAAALFAAVSAGYAIRGGGGAAPSAQVPASGTPSSGTPSSGAPSSGAPTFAAPSGGAVPFGASVFGPAADAGSAGPATVVAARESREQVAARPARTPRYGDAAPGTSTRDAADSLGEPAYIPLPAGALEAGALLGPASAGIPVWAAALLAGEAPTQLRSVAPGGPAVRLVGLSH